MDSEPDEQSIPVTMEPLRLHCPSSDSLSKPLISKQNRVVSTPELPFYLQNGFLILLILFAFCCFGVAIFIGLAVNFNYTSYDVNWRRDECPCLVPHLKGVRTSLRTPQLVPPVEVSKATHLHNHPFQSKCFKWKLERIPKGRKPISLSCELRYPRFDASKK